jgi:hypothetical protein
MMFVSPSELYAQNINSDAIKDWAPLPEGLNDSIEKAFESPTKKSTFTIRKFEVEQQKLLKDQVNNWIKDYNSYGFSVMTHKPLKLKTGAKGFFIEAFHKDFDKVFSQFVSVKEGEMSTLTCKSSDDTELKKCKEAMMTFEW